MSKINLKLFKKVRDRIAAIPESYDQGYWVEDSKRAPCGTVACLAGETIICAARSVEAGIQRLRELDEGGDIPNTAAKLLGLRGNYWDVDEEEVKIFLGNGNGFPEPFKTQYRRARSRRSKAEVVVAYLDHVIETGKVLG